MRALDEERHFYGVCVGGPRAAQSMTSRSPTFCVQILDTDGHRPWLQPFITDKIDPIPLKTGVYKHQAIRTTEACVSGIWTWGDMSLQSALDLLVNAYVVLENNYPASVLIGREVVK